MAYTGVYKRKDGRRKAKLILDCYDRKKRVNRSFIGKTADNT